MCYNLPALDNQRKSDSKIQTWHTVVAKGLLVLALFGATLFLRFGALGAAPPGLYRDEAFNGLDALTVLEGRRPLYFVRNNGREPLFIYLISLSLALFGRNPAAIRGVAGVLGTLTIPVGYGLGRALSGPGRDRERVGWLTAATLAVTFWPVHLSRIGFRAVALPLFVGLALWLAWLAWRRDSWPLWALAGLAYGLSFYTYLAARFSPLALLAFALYLAVTGRAKRAFLRGAALFVLSAALVIAPLGAYALGHWDQVMGRGGQVSVFAPAINGGDLGGTLLRHTGRVLGMWVWHGDNIPRHNLPGRPVFDPLMGLAFLTGLLLALRRLRTDRAPACALALIWLAVMSLPTLLAGDAPHFIRGAGVWPLAALFSAWGLAWLWSRLDRLGRGERSRLWFFAPPDEPQTLRPGWLGGLGVGLILALSLGLTVRDYFGRYAPADETAYAFEAAAVSLADEANRFLDAGELESGARRLYVAGSLWQEWTAVSFLVPQERVTLLEKGAEPPPAPSGPVLLILWQYADMDPYLALLPNPAQVTVGEGPLTRGDLEPEPYPAFISLLGEPVSEAPGQPLARFADGIELYRAGVELEADGRWRVALTWRRAALSVAEPEQLNTDWTVFVHLLRDGMHVDQADRDPALGIYPTSVWRPGDLVVDRHWLSPLGVREPERYQIAVGLYRRDTLDRLPVLSGGTSDDSVILAAPDGEKR